MARTDAPAGGAARWEEMNDPLIAEFRASGGSREIPVVVLERIEER